MSEKQIIRDAQDAAEMWLYDGDRDHPLPGYEQVMRLVALRVPTGAAARLLAKHQLADILPGGVLCTCGAELAALNPPLDDGAVKGQPLALAVHQLQELESAR